MNSSDYLGTYSKYIEIQFIDIFNSKDNIRMKGCEGDVLSDASPLSHMSFIFILSLTYMLRSEQYL
jgi:hypothetical protein